MNTIIIGVVLLLVFVVLYMLFNTGSSSKSLEPPVVTATPPPTAATATATATEAAPAPVATTASEPSTKPTLPQVAPMAHKVKEIEGADEARAFLATSQAGMMLVYAPWCGHCRSMMTDFEAASVLSPARFSRLDGAKAQDFMREKEIRGFPTIFTVSAKGVVERWMGGRDQASLVAGAAALVSA